MKRFKQLALATLLVAAAGAATAVPTSIIDEIDGKNHKVTLSTPKDFTHTITDQGYVLGSDTIESAKLFLFLYDGIDQKTEKYAFSIGTNGVVQDVTGNNITNGSHDFEIVLVGALDTLIAQGFLDVTLTTAVQNRNDPAPDYTFLKSVLDVTMKEVTTVQPAPSAVPEPAGLALLGLGLLGAAFARRRRK